MSRILLDTLQANSGVGSARPVAGRNPLPDNQLFSSLRTDEFLDLARLTRLYMVGPEFTFTGRMVEGEVTILDPRAE